MSASEKRSLRERLRPKERKPAVRWLLTVLLLAAAVLGLHMLLQMIGTLDFSRGRFSSYLHVPKIYLLNLLPVALLVAFTYFATNRAWLGFLIPSVLLFIMDFVNYFKVTLRGDPFVAEDFLTIGEGAGIIGQYTLHFPAMFFVGIALIAAGPIVLHRWARGRVPKKRWWLRVLALVLIVLLGFGAWAAAKPADELSLSERRPLAQMPELSASSYLSGKFMSGYEDYATDQFPLREQFRTLKALMGLYVFGQKDNNGVYLADGFAAKLEYPLNEGSVAHAADRFRYLYETLMAGTDAKVYLSVIPDKNYFLAETNGYPALDYQALTDALRKQTEFAAYIDLFGTLTADDYYRTDSHWRQENLLTTADTLAAAMGVALPDNRYTEWTLDRPYYGVYYGYAALPMEPDHLTYLTSDLLDACTVYNYETGKTGPIYDLAKGAGKDPYELFLSGSVSLLTIENPNADTDRELVIFRDSFGSSLAPLLVPGYAKVTLADIRYLPSSQMGKYLTFTDQDVLFLYSAPVLNNSETLK